MSTPLGKTLLPTHYGILYYAKDASQLKFYDIRYPHHRCRKCKILRKDYGGKNAGSIHLGPLFPMYGQICIALNTINAATNTPANSRSICLNGLF